MFFSLRQNTFGMPILLIHLPPVGFDPNDIFTSSVFAVFSEIAGLI